MVTIEDLAKEMQSFVEVEESILRMAAESGINNESHRWFAFTVDGWQAGNYDEDPELLVQRLENLLINEKINR